MLYLLHVASLMEKKKILINFQNHNPQKKKYIKNPQNNEHAACYERQEASQVAECLWTCLPSRRQALIPGWGRSPGVGNGNPLQYSWLGNPPDRGAWWTTVHGVAEDMTEWACMHEGHSWQYLKAHTPLLTWGFCLCVVRCPMFTYFYFMHHLFLKKVYVA